MFEQLKARLTPGYSQILYCEKCKVNGHTDNKCPNNNKNNIKIQKPNYNIKK